MSRLSVLTCFGVVMLMAPRSSAQETKAPQKTIDPARLLYSDMKQVVDSNNRFAFDLYAQLRKRPGNLFFSPYSLSSALAMTYAWATGDNAKQMAYVLRFTLPPDRLHPAFGKLIRTVEKPGQTEKFQLRVANSMWVHEGHALDPDFLRINQTHYQAGLRHVDFLHKTDDARQAINAWVEERTNDKIQNLIEHLSPRTKVILANAIYFKGDWTEPFDSELTTERDFHLSKTNKITGRMMAKPRTLASFCDAGDFKVLRLAYDNCSAYFVLPHQMDGIAEMEKRLTYDRWADCLAKMKGYEVDLILPKFRISGSFQLQEELQRLGMTAAFGRWDGFQKTSEKASQPLAISSVIHKSFISVEEKETEAAAGSALVFVSPVSKPGIPVPPPKAVFHATHPFLFLIRENATGSILFVGRVTDPSLGVRDRQ